MNRLLFAPESPRRVALMRIGLGLILLWHAGYRWRYAVELHSTFGPAMPIFLRGEPAVAPPAEPPAGSSGIANDVGRSAVGPQSLLPVPTPTEAVLAHSLLLFLLLAITFGWWTRTSLVLAALLLVWLGPLDVAATFAKPLVISLHLLVLLTFAGSGRAWSIDARCAARTDDFCRLAPAWPRRLMQVLVCAIYFGAAMTKLRTASFLSGDLLGFSLLDDHWGGDALGRWLSAQPRALALLSLGTVLFELFFPVLVWVRRLRIPMLAAAFTFHAAMGLVMHLSTFSPTMFVALLAFLTEDDLGRLRLPPCGSGAIPPESSRLRAASRMPPLALFAFGACAIATSLGGLFLQRHFDWYGAFGRRPLRELLAFESIPPAEWANMQAARQPAWEDFVHRIALGSRTNGRSIFGPSDRLAHGDRLYVQVQFLPRHPNLLLEGLLIAPDGREAARFSHRVTPGYDYAIDGFELTYDLPPGKYRLLLQVEGFEFAERDFELTD